jgi:outer membrane protein
MKNRVIVFTALLGLLISPVLALGQTPAASQGKIGVINIQEAIMSTGEGKKAVAELQKKYQPRQQELQRLQQEIQGINDQLQKQGATLSDEEQRRLNRELEIKQTQLKRSTEDFNADAGADRDEALRRIGQKLVRLISDYAQQNGFVLVIDGAQIPVYFAAKDIDLTEEMVKRYDTANPVAEAGAGAPAAPTAPAARTAAPPVKPAASPKPTDKPKP